ncbi:Biotin transporter BioY [bacterium HR39]|nr:Biotin transporter BioY [bacterium HR39]
MTLERTVFAIDRIWRPRAGAPEGLRVAALAVLGSLLLWASAKIQVPFWPVPVTLQTAAVFLIGLACGPRLGLATVALYLAEGAAGLPVFAGTPEKGVGLPYMLGPTGGYLAGFLAAAWIAGRAAELRLRLPALVGMLLLASVAIYVPGLLWLSTFVGPEKAVQLGLLPFVLGDLVKLLLVAFVYEAALRPKDEGTSSRH